MPNSSAPIELSQLPWSESCERNKDPILEVLRDAFADSSEVLEVGAGTGQHACYFASHLPHLNWHPSDAGDIRPLAARIAGYEGDNLAAPLALDVDAGNWPDRTFDAVFSANTLHIMKWSSVHNFFAGLRQVLAPGGVLVVYGPFNQNGDYTAASNAAFDKSLRADGTGMGIRDLEAVDKLAETAGLKRQECVTMPANNFCVIWRSAAA